jgi:hypothetical protein
VALPFRFEDLILTGWVAVASPLLFRIGGEKGPFDAGQPVAGMLRLVAVGAVLLCVAARKAPDPDGKTQPGLLDRGAVGPLFGGFLLVAISGFTALGASSQLGLVVVVAAGVAMIIVRFVLPPLTPIARRALLCPFVAITGGLYWTFIEAVLPNQRAAQLRHAAFIDPHAATPILLFLVAFSVVYYAMLIYAPRQIAEREGGLAVWVARYLAFAASIALGVGWLSILSG